MVCQVHSRLSHPATRAGRTDTAVLARERNQEALTTATTPCPRKPETEQSAGQIPHLPLPCASRHHKRAAALKAIRNRFAPMAKFSTGFRSFSPFSAVHEASESATCPQARGSRSQLFGYSWQVRRLRKCR